MDFPNYIDGRWVSTGNAIDNMNPSDLSDKIGRAAVSELEVLDMAIEAAAKAQQQWAHSTPQARFDVLDSIGSGILEKREELGRLLSREEGKPLAEGIGEVTRAGHIFKFFAGECLRQGGEFLDSVRTGVNVEVVREPVGVVGLITPWNFPIAIPAWKTAPALACGNAVILKPAVLVPASAHALATIIAQSGLPDGVFNLVFGPGSEVGPRLAEHQQVAAVSFTGSKGNGIQLAAKCAESMKKVQLEMGGKNPIIILDDADIELAIEACINGAFYSTGQRCTASSRIIVTEGIYEAFTRRLEEERKTLRIGNALDPDVQIGPVVDANQLHQNLDYLDVARREGGQVKGGEPLKLETEGYYMSPAVVYETTNNMRINREETFGPIASVISVRDYEEALEVANDTEFGLSAGICTTSLKHANHFKRHASAGMVMVNLPTAGVDYHVPFGGIKGSSLGSREQGKYAAEFYTHVKTRYICA